MFEASKELNIGKIIITSTSEVYGSALLLPINESHPLQPQSPYSASKIGADNLGNELLQLFDLPLATIRPFNTYGPRQSAGLLFQQYYPITFIKKIYLGNTTTMRFNLCFRFM